MKRSRRKLAYIAGGCLAATGALTSGALAFFTAGGTNTGSAQVATLAAPTDVTAAQRQPGIPTVQIGWKGLTETPGDQPLDGYYAERLSGGAASPACGSSAGALLPATSRGCDDTGVPAGAATYRVTAVFRSWTSVSDPSPTMTVVVDRAAPAVAVISPAARRYNAAGWAAACSSTICGTAVDSNDAPSGLASVELTLRAGSEGYWDGSAFAGTSPVPLTAQGTSQWSLPFSASSFPADGPYTVEATATDHNGNRSEVASVTFVYDTQAPAAPVVGSVTTPINAGNQAAVSVSGTAEAHSTVTVTLEDATAGTVDAGSTAADADGHWTISGIDASSLADGTITAMATATDSAGNTGPAGTGSAAKDTVAPGVTVAKKAGQADPTNVKPARFTVTFTEPVAGFDAGDLILGGTAPGPTATVTPGGADPANTFEVAVTPSGNGTITVEVSAAATTDAAGNASTASTGPASVTYDGAAPVVSSIGLAGANPTNAASVSWTARFSEAVSGVDASDFQVVVGNRATGSITAVSPAPGSDGSTYTVTADTGPGSGTLQLRLYDNDSVVDLAGNRLGGTGTGNGNFVGAKYTIDKTAPTVKSIARRGTNPAGAATVSWTVTFTESVRGVNPSDFTLSTTGVSDATLTGVSAINGFTYVVTASTGTGDGTIGLNLADDDSIADIAGNVLGGPGSGNGDFTGDVYTIDGTP